MRIRIRGTVQGVGFRPAVYRTAVSLNLNGSVWNDGSDVVIDINDASRFLKEFEKNVPPLAVIEDISIQNVPFKGDKGFSIIRSSDGSGGVGIPADTAVCDNCLKDMKEGRRKGYEFTTCTDCGARFTLLTDLPYDRNNTAMAEFPMCPSCKEEYNDPNNRRFHHQTVCCPDCGPKYRLIDGRGSEIPGDPVTAFANILENGKIGVAKSWGGMHICALPEKIGELREWYRRPQKPFALMVRDIGVLREYAEPNEKEMEQVTSVHRPIVLMKKTENDITELISPGLDSIGIFLPYTGMQHKLLNNVKGGALIMTSANLPGEPMLLDDGDVTELNADAYLLHDQRIMNRADDSVVRVNCGSPMFIRKSRGHVPSYISIDAKGCSVGIGAQENLTASVAFNGRIHTTQHIGDGDSLGVPEYLDSSTHSLIRMLKCEPSVVAMDMHPGYSNRPLGRILSEEFGAELMEVQHHWAHAASLLAENGIDECISLSLDGTGYGADGNAWGGEILRADLSSYERLAHLQNIPLLGSEKALYDLRRLKFAIDELNGIDSGMFDERSTEVLRKLMPSSVKTSSFGRLLDAISFTLGVCEKRTYDGEPAMKLEALLARGKMIDGFSAAVKGDEIITTDLFTQMKREQNKNDVAYSMVRSVVNAMVDVACSKASDLGIDHIGLTGGVSYNGPICTMFTEEVSKRGLKALMHTKVPNGDGGISVGQAAIAAKRLE